MLKSFSTLNFIHFTEAQRLEFESGVNFFVGENSTGKSAVFELIRRCLSNEVTSKYSWFNVSHDIAYAVSHFQFPCDISSFKGLHITTNKNLKDVIACLFIDIASGESTSEKLYHYYKVLCTIHENDDSDNQVYVFVKRYRGDFASDADALVPFEASNFCSNWKKLEPDKIIKHVKPRQFCDDEIRKLFNEIKKEEFFHDNTFCDDDMSTIYNLIQSRYLGVMPMRSIGPLQWTWSERNKHIFRMDNYKTASDRAEIIRELLGSDQIDEKLEQQFCEALSLPCRFKKGEDGQIWVNYYDKEDIEVPLLKTPEGVIELKQVCLILAHKQLLTITLEEPDHGIHDLKLIKLREEVFKKIRENKTVLVTSHRSAFMDNETMKMTFLFSRKRKMNEAGISHSVTRMPENYKRYGCMEEMKQMLFSDITLFVPGYTDKIIIEAVFGLLIKNKNYLKKMIGNKEDKQLTVDCRKYLLRISVAEMHGEFSGPKKKEFCNEIGRAKKTCLMYDFDMVQITKPPILTIGGKKIGLGTLGLDTKFFTSLEDFYNDEESFNKFINECNEGQVFVWKYGDIEDVINKIEDKINPELKKRLGIPIEGKSKWKKQLAQKDFDDILAVATALIEYNDDIERFIKFLWVMKQHSD